MSNRILLVEDDQSFGAVLKDYLMINNFDGTLATDGELGLKEFTEYFISKKVSGKGSKLERAGLISMSDKERAAVLANFKAGKAVK